MKKIYLVFIINLLLLDIVCIFALIKFVSYGENKKNDNSPIKLNNRAKMVHRSTKIPDEDGKKVLLQTEPYFGGQRVLTRLKINENVFMGRSLNEINKQINESPNIVANNLQEAVWHENGHAKTYFNKTIDEVEEINNELDNIHFDKLSPTASQNGSELIAEVEVLLKRGEEVPREAINIYKRYIGG